MIFQKINIFFILFVCFCSTSLFGQQTEGYVLDQNNNRIAFAEIIIHGEDNFSKILMADEQGNFSTKLPHYGKYNIEIFKDDNTIYSEKMILDSDSAQSIKTGFTPNKDNHTPIIKLEKGQLTLFFSQSKLAKSGDLFVALQNINYLKIENDTFFYKPNNKSLSFVLDGQPKANSLSTLKKELENVDSDGIGTIVINQDSDGHYRLDIKTINYENSGWSGDFISTFNQATYSTYSNNFTLNYQNSKLSSSLSINQGQSKKANSLLSNLIGDASLTNTDVKIDNSLLSNDNTKQKTNDKGANLALFYKFNKKSSFALFYSIDNTNTYARNLNKSEYQRNGITDSILTTNSFAKTPETYHAVNSYYDYFWGEKADKKFRIGANYYYNRPITETNFTTTSNKNNNILNNYTWNQVLCIIWSGQANVTLPYSWATVEIGTRYANFTNNADSRFYSIINNDYQLVPANTNSFDYTEENIGAHLEFSRKINEAWNTNIGADYEYSIIKTSSLDAFGNSDPNAPKQDPYANFLPYANVTYTPNKNHTFSINYEKTMTRPSFSSLTRYKKYSNPFSYSSGNEILKPTYIQKLQFSYAYKDFFSTQIFAEKISNDVGQIVNFVNGVKSAIFKNYMDYQNIGLSARVNFPIMPWWQTVATTNISYSKAKALVMDVKPLNGVCFNYNIENTLRLNNLKTFYYLVNFYHQIGFSKSNVYTQSTSNFSTGLRFAFLDQKLKIDATVVDLFKGMVTKSRDYYRGYNIFEKEYVDTRSFNLSLSYNFGNNKVKAVQMQNEFIGSSRLN